MRFLVLFCIVLLSSVPVYAQTGDGNGTQPDPASAAETGFNDSSITSSAADEPLDPEATAQPFSFSPRRSPEPDFSPVIVSPKLEAATPDYSFTVEWANFNFGFDTAENFGARLDLGLFTLNYKSISWTIAEFHPTIFIGPIGGATRLAWRYGLDPNYTNELRIGGLFTGDAHFLNCKATSYIMFGPFFQFIHNANWATLGVGLDIPTFGWHGVGIASEDCDPEYPPRFGAPPFVAFYFRVGFQSIRVP